MLCATCGTSKKDYNGMCINGHDDWVEWIDLNHYLYYDIVTRAIEASGLSFPEFALKLYNSDDSISQRLVFPTIFHKKFYKK